MPTTLSTQGFAPANVQSAWIWIDQSCPGGIHGTRGLANPDPPVCVLVVTRGDRPCAPAGPGDRRESVAPWSRSVAMGGSPSASVLECPVVRACRACNHHGDDDDDDDDDDDGDVCLGFADEEDEWWSMCGANDDGPISVIISSIIISIISSTRWWRKPWDTSSRRRTVDESSREPSSRCGARGDDDVGG